VEDRVDVRERGIARAVSEREATSHIGG
jgi:hypothetical protein